MSLSMSILSGSGNGGTSGVVSAFGLVILPVFVALRLVERNLGLPILTLSPCTPAAAGAVDFPVTVLLAGDFVFVLVVRLPVTDRAVPRVLFVAVALRCPHFA